MLRKILLAVFLCIFMNSVLSDETNKVVCYHGSWSKYRSGNGLFTISDINPKLCTHLIYAFVGISTDGTVAILDQTLEVQLGNLEKFNELKGENPNLKTLLAIGGWNEGSIKYSTVVADATKRATFIQSALEIVQKYNFDGFDLDWEYPAQRGGSWDDKENFATLLKEFRQVWDKYGLLLTAAVSASLTVADASYDVPALSQYLDIINVMTYDFHSYWDGVTGQNAPLYASSTDTTSSAKLLNVNASIRGWIERGADPQKIALGLAAYGRSFTLSDSTINGVGAPVAYSGNSGKYTLEPGMLGYNEICELQLDGGWTVVWDDQQKNPYTYKDTQWVGYDNPKSIAIKVDFAKSLNLGGVMVWSIEMDDFNGICGSKYPILTAIQTALGDTSPSSSSSTAASTSVSTTSTTPSTSISTASTSISTASISISTTASTTSTPISTAASTTTSASASESTSNICIESGYVRDAENCSIFYYCLLNRGVYEAIKLTCASGLLYDTEKLICNYPSAVNC